jgi:hypothetical protein
MKTIVHSLIEFPEEFEPLKLECIVDEQNYRIPDEWWLGYPSGGTGDGPVLVDERGDDGPTGTHSCLYRCN